MMRELVSEGSVPQVAVKTHLDGDPKPRPDEVAEWDAIRKEHGLAQMLCMILLPDDPDNPSPVAPTPDDPFPGYQMHGWKITDDGVEPEEINVQIVPDEDEVPQFEMTTDHSLGEGNFGVGRPGRFRGDR